MTDRIKGKWRKKRKLPDSADGSGLLPPKPSEGVAQSTWYRWNKQALDAAREDTIFKPGELIDVRGHGPLTLTQRRALTLLWRHALTEGLAAGRVYVLPAPEMLARGVVGDTLSALLTTQLHLVLPDGGTWVGPWLAFATATPSGTVSFTLEAGLVEGLRRSTEAVALSGGVLKAFRSRYALTLYEHACRHTAVRGKRSRSFTVAELRAVLGAPAAAFDSVASLMNHVVQPAIDEINVLAAFTLSCAPIRPGRGRIPKVRLEWRKKTAGAKRDALLAQLQAKKHLTEG